MLKSGCPYGEIKTVLRITATDQEALLICGVDSGAISIELLHARVRKLERFDSAIRLLFLWFSKSKIVDGWLSEWDT
jgi:hypothetical protein